MTYTNIIPNHSLKNIHQHTYLVVTITFTKSFDFQSSLYYQQTMTIFISQQLKITFCSFRVYLCIYLYMYVCKYVSVLVWVYGWFVGDDLWVVGGGGGEGPAQNAYSGIEREWFLNAALRHNT